VAPGVPPGRWDAVRRWRDRLRRADPTAIPVGLSPEGVREVWAAALDALSDEALAEAAAIPGRPFRTATFVAAGTVVTAPIEWCAVLLGRGTRVTLKHPHDDAGLAPLLAAAAAEEGLPLAITGARSAVRDAELVVAMGSDDSIASIRADVAPFARFLPHGHKFSVAAGFQPAAASWQAIAADAALHDGRGCLSPIAVFTPLPLEAATDALAAAMADAQARWPVGEVAPAEHAAIRSRRALAKVAGVVREGPGWSVHGLPADKWTPLALPRSVVVISVPTPEEAAAVLAPHGRHLSTVGTDGPSTPFVEAGATRICRLGRMQRPPLARSHDGEDWLRATIVHVTDER
jgi:hypothetical protein